MSAKSGRRASGFWALLHWRHVSREPQRPRSLKPEALIAALCAAMSVLAQQPAETVNVHLIEVPVTVVDRDGRAIRGLTAANFEITDDGKRREVTHFETVDVKAGLRVTAAEPVPGAPRVRPYTRNFMLLFDLTDSAPATLERARQAALEFVDKQVQPIDRVAVGTVSVKGGFSLLANFTFDRELVRAVVSTMGGPKEFLTTDPLMLAVDDYERSEFGRAAEHFESLKLETRKAAREEKRHLILRRMDNLAELGRVLDRIGGRKQIVLLSEGFDAKALQGRESLMDKEATKERDYVERGEIWHVDPEARYGSSDALMTQKRMVETLKRSDVVLHALDIKGLRHAVDETGAKTTSTESLSLLARDTGGSVFQSSNDMGEHFARLLAQQEVTYVLGFQTSSAASGKFHNLKVRLIDVPAGARVSHRMGYYEQSRATVDLDLAFTAAEILTNAIPVDDLRVRAFTAAFPHSPNVAQAPVVLEIDGASLLAGTKNATVPAEFFIYAFDTDGVARDFAVEKVSLDMAKVGARLEAKGLKFYHTLLLPPGDYSVRALVRTEGGRSGFAMVPLHVAASGEPHVAPALLDAGEGWVLVKGRDRAAAPVYPFVAGDLVFVPSVRPALQSGKAYDLALMTHNVPVENMQLGARIEGNGTNESARLSLIGRTSADDAGGVKLMLQMTPPPLARGEYRLIMTMRAADAAGERTVSVPFEVR